MNCHDTHKNNSLDRICQSCGGHESCTRRPFLSRHMTHAETIRTLFGTILSFNNLHELQDGCHVIDHNYGSQGNEYKHGITFKYYSGDVAVDYEKLKSFFISRVKSFKSANSYSQLGEAFHPLLDSYLSLNERVEFSLDYFTYDRPNSILNEMYLSSSFMPSKITNMLTLHNFILNMPSSASENDIGMLFEAWLISHSDKYN